MRTVDRILYQTQALLGYGVVQAAGSVPDELLQKVVELLGLVILVINTFLTWRRARRAS